jgi:hypothetical protein
VTKERKEKRVNKNSSTLSGFWIPT